MIDKILNNKTFIDLMQKSIYECLQILIQEDIEFNIIVNTKFVTLEPPLPQDLDVVSKNHYCVFALGGYTFKSIVLNKEHIEFHAGFGPDDFATFVKVDLGAITQIQVEDNIIFVNFSNYFKKQSEQKLKEKSMNAFLNNPNNKDLFKK
ncbi:hypothetical protein CSUB8523_1326 [Campylobacter subantarcticus LMG 24377]|uniref:Stringent starvation protein B n=2 Tax=Campylobacter subantarcticus TaxID=497724 RepID=A0A0A8HAG2_9BACT|nr:hypothetical protein [Campylobacter subantarcticus]EAJ1260534.1 hypothetical protein [Campylobacter lari]AJC91051.1 hypothetical protein CSUB8521_1220 [Campylobacter subantarcticus LMG 24374]AJC92830.1 hypothetical protein CSUB8523_1326 [Campylobacter subantarcticus LMG 24377]EAL3938254.1 hypothetical protein [Campylobacter lari]MPB99180.1 hypothetical protein [Campylobacter subantarcticus]